LEVLPSLSVLAGFFTYPQEAFPESKASKRKKKVFKQTVSAEFLQQKKYDYNQPEK